MFFPSKDTSRQSRSTNIQAEYADEPRHVGGRRNTLPPSIIRRKLASMGPAQRARLRSEVGDPYSMNRREQERFLRKSSKRRYS